MKTINKILSDIYVIINASPIAALNGGIYKKIRPTGSELEDCIINVIPGTVRKFSQNGALYLKIYYLDLYQNNTYFEDTARGEQLEQLLLDLSEILLKNNTYVFDVQSRQIDNESIVELHQHLVILKMNFEILI